MTMEKTIVITELEFEIGDEVWVWIPEQNFLAPVTIDGIQADISNSGDDEEYECDILYKLEWDNSRDHLVDFAYSTSSEVLLDKDDNPRLWKAEYIFANMPDFAAWLEKRIPGQWWKQIK